MTGKPRTTAGHALLDKAKASSTFELRIAAQELVYVVDAIETETRQQTLAEVLRGLRSEDDSTQLRAIIASVEALSTGTP